MEKRFIIITDEIECLEKPLSKVIQQVADARRIAFSQNATEDDRKHLRSLELKAKEINDRISTLIDEAQKLVGIPNEVFERIEELQTGGDSFESTQRELLAHDQLPSTDKIDDSLADSLDLFKNIVSKNWLNNQKANNYQLDEHYLNTPLSVVRGIRIESEFSPVHRFAQGLLVAEDFLEGNPRYDFWAGSLLVPQLCALGTKFHVLKDVKGEVHERISSLSNSDSKQADATIFELLVAASCTQYGREMEFLPTSNIKTPDLRVHNHTIPLVIECKRKQVLTDYELVEEHLMRKLFCTLHAACATAGINGVYNLKLKVEANELPVNDIIKVAVSLRLSPLPNKEFDYEWGTISFHPLPEIIYLPDTNLYSPNFLMRVFSWDIDLPPYDGIICKVKSPDDIVVNIARDPIALTWSNLSQKSIKRKTWTVTSSFAQAIKQVPKGEVGIVYMCYQEGTRPEHANKRIDLLSKQMEKWKHCASIRLPINFAIRLLPRPLSDGRPDLIENGFRFCSGLYGDPIYFRDFPTCVFHTQIPLTTDQILSR